jgi:hypothetical protein
VQPFSYVLPLLCASGCIILMAEKALHSAVLRKNPEL